MSTVDLDEAAVDVDSAARRVLARLGTPLHERATIAALETDGIRDADAPSIAPGCSDVFQLGRHVHARCLELAHATDERARRTRSRPATAGWKRVLRRYGRGLAYSLPMLVQGAALATLHVSLWGSRALTRGEQTAIGLALVASLVACGPVSQALTHRLYYYRYQKDPRALQRTALRWIAVANAAGLAVAALVAATSAIAGRSGAATIAFCLFLGLQPGMWMANAALFAVRRSLFAGIAVAISTIGAWAALRAGAPPLAAHAGGLAAADLMLFTAVLLLLRRSSRLAAPARRSLPLAALPLAVGGYAAWGLVYFLLIFSDRLVAWVGGAHVAFQPHYEAALQLALVPFLIILPALEHVLVRFGELLETTSRYGNELTAAAERRRATRALTRLILTALAAYVLLAGAVWVAVQRWPERFPLGVGRLVAHGEPHAALGLALAAYGCFVVALGIGSAYQLLARPWPLVAVGSVAVAVDLAVGLAVRSNGPPELAAVGLLAGGIVFMTGLALVWRRQRRRLDHLWFAAS